ncbi:MAG: hypothetical protein HQ592_11975 [Planctomycetes bacterium]|nr:hypothetical protein [Planctomycetota bacterium]
MSYEDGMAAINLEMPKRIPRTEYSPEGHYPLQKAVTGIDVCADSPDEVRREAWLAFIRAWNYDFFWATNIAGGIFEGKCSSMGHAVYAEKGTDFNPNITNLYDDPEEALNLDMWEQYGTRDKKEITKFFEDCYKGMCQGTPDGVNMTGIYTTCISGLIDIFGWEMLLLAAGTDQVRFGQLTNRYAEWIQQYFDALADADVPVVMIHDDMVWTEGPFISPDWYRKYVFPNFKKYFAPLIDSGKKIIFTADGNYTEFIDDLVGCGVHGFVLEPLTDMAYIAERYGQTHAFIGNADTRILLRNNKADIRAEVERCINIGKNCPGYFMAVGNHIPPNTPVEAALYYNECYEKLSKR